MEHIKELLAKVLKKRGLYNHAIASQIVLHAQQWIICNIPDFQDQIIASSYQNGCLLIKAANAIAAHECGQLKHNLEDFLINTKAHDIQSIRILRT